MSDFVGRLDDFLSEFAEARAARREQKRAMAKEAADALWSIRQKPSENVMGEPVGSSFPGAAAVKVADRLLKQYRLPMYTLRYLASKRVGGYGQHGMTDGCVMLSLELKSPSGPSRIVDLPVFIHQGNVLEPSTLLCDGTPRVIAQSTFDDLINDRVFMTPDTARKHMYSPPPDLTRRPNYNPVVRDNMYAFNAAHHRSAGDLIEFPGNQRAEDDELSRRLDHLRELASAGFGATDNAPAPRLNLSAEGDTSGPTPIRLAPGTEYTVGVDTTAMRLSDSGLYTLPAGARVTIEEVNNLGDGTAIIFTDETGERWYSTLEEDGFGRAMRASEDSSSKARAKCGVCGHPKKKHPEWRRGEGSCECESYEPKRAGAVRVSANDRDIPTPDQAAYRLLGWTVDTIKLGEYKDIAEVAETSWEEAWNMFFRVGGRMRARPDGVSLEQWRAEAKAYADEVFHILMTEGLPELEEAFASREPGLYEKRNPSAASGAREAAPRAAQKAPKVDVPGWKDTLDVGERERKGHVPGAEVRLKEPFWANMRDGQRWKISRGSTGVIVRGDGTDGTTGISEVFVCFSRDGLTVRVPTSKLSVV